MDKQEIQKLIEEAIKYKTETNSVEFKDARGGLPKSTWKSISAFSHKPGGGIIVFGITEDKDKHEIKITGTGILDNLQEKIGDLVNNEMSFIIRPTYHILEIEERTLLAVFIPECPDQFKPCYYNPAGMTNGAYIRDGNTDRKMTDDEMRNLIDNSKKFKFDISPHSFLGSSTLNVGTISGGININSVPDSLPKVLGQNHQQSCRFWSQVKYSQYR